MISVRNIMSITIRDIKKLLISMPKKQLKLIKCISKDKYFWNGNLNMSQLKDYTSQSIKYMSESS